MSCGCNTTTPSCPPPQPSTVIIPGGPGAPGANGATWFPIPTIPTNDVGVNGDFALLTDGSVYIKQSGTWIFYTSLAGADGAAWLSGTGAPASLLGEDGDWYINVANGDAYKKTSGIWGVELNLKGPTGATGAAGATGPAGPPGNSLIYCVSSTFFDPAVPTTEIGNSFGATSGAKALGTFNKPNGVYVVDLNVWAGWNSGAAGSNMVNGSFDFKINGVTYLGGIKWGRFKGGSSGHAYGTYQGLNRLYVAVPLNNGDVLTIAPVGTYTFLIEANIKIFNQPA